MTLIGYWPLNEENGDTAYDYSGNENHGELRGNPTVVDGILGDQAVEFDGEDDYINTNEHFKEETSNSKLSLSIWVNFRDLSSRHQGILNFEHSGTRIALIHGRHYFEIDTSEDSVRIEIDPEEYGTEEDRWYHFVMSADGEKLRAYINGDLVGEEEYDPGDGLADDVPLVIATRGDDIGDRIFDGLLYDARIYNRGLTPAEIQYLYSVSQRGRLISDKKQS